MAQFQILTQFRHQYTVTLTYGRNHRKAEEAPLLTIRIKHSDTGISKSAIVYIY